MTGQKEYQGGACWLVVVWLLSLNKMNGDMQMKTLPLFGWLTFVLAGIAVVLGLPVGSPLLANDVPAVSPGSWTLAILPDTQDFAQSFPDTFTAQTQWIADNQVSQNTQFVLHEGDIVNVNNDTQWDRAQTSLNVLLDNDIPTALAVGNHEYVGGGLTRVTQFNESRRFGPGSAYANQSTFGGVFEAGETANSYQTFNAGGEDWLVLSLEFGARDAVVDWANLVVSANPNHKAILLTHAYLFSDGSRYDFDAKGTSQPFNPHASPVADLPGGVNDGEQLWDKLVSKHENFEFVFSGHSVGTDGTDGSAQLASVGDNGNVVHQVSANYQSPILPDGGPGFLRLLEFKNDNETVEVRTFSPLLGEFNESPDQQFTLNRNSVFALPAGLDIIANYEFTGGDFNDPNLVSTDVDPDTTASDFGVGPGFASLSSAAGDPARSFFGSQAFEADEADAIAAGHYITFTITPGINPLDLITLTFDFQRDNVTDGVQSYTLRSDAGGDDFGTLLLTGTINGTTGRTGDFFANSADLSSIAALSGLTSATELRLYLFGTGIVPANPNYRLDNLRLFGTSVPEPSSLMLLLLGSGVVLIRRRQR